MDLTPKQQTSEAIRQAETIVVLTGQHPSVDQVSAVIALAMILRKFGKKVSAVISDTLPQSVQLLETGNIERNLGGLRDFILKVDMGKAQVDQLRYDMADGKLNIFLSPQKGSFAPSDVTFDYGEASFEYDLAMVLGVPTRARIDKVYDQNQALFAQIPLVNLDFHRTNENYGAVNLVEPNASSLCEMLVALAESLQSGIIDADIATALLMGIVGSTDRFTASHTTSKSLTVAAQMMAAGAKQQAVVRALYREGGRNERGGNAERNNRDNNRDRSQNDRSHSGRDASSRDNGPRENGQREASTRDNATRETVSRDNREPAQRESAQPQRDTQREVQREPAARVQQQQPSAPVAAPLTAEAKEAMAAQPTPIATSPRNEPAPERPQPQYRQPQPPQPQPVAYATPGVPTVTASMMPAAAVPSAVSGMPAAAPEATSAPDMRPFRAAEQSLPIIDPGHIELSEPPVASSAAVPTGMPAASMTPAADFAAAAQVLVQPPVAQPRPERAE